MALKWLLLSLSELITASYFKDSTLKDISVTAGAVVYHLMSHEVKLYILSKFLVICIPFFHIIHKSFFFFFPVSHL